MAVDLACFSALIFFLAFTFFLVSVNIAFNSEKTGNPQDRYLQTVVAPRCVLDWLVMRGQKQIYYSHWAVCGC